MTIYVVQFAHGGIPEEPEVYTDREVALRRYVELGVAWDMPYDEERGTFEDDDNDVRMWEDLETRTQSADPAETHGQGDPAVPDRPRDSHLS